MVMFPKHVGNRYPTPGCLTDSGEAVDGLEKGTSSPDTEKLYHKKWSPRRESNSQHAVYKTAALPIELLGLLSFRCLKLNTVELRTAPAPSSQRAFRLVHQAGQCRRLAP